MTVTRLHVNIGTDVQRKNIHLTPKCSSVYITKSLKIRVQSLKCCKLAQLTDFSGKMLMQLIIWISLLSSMDRQATSRTVTLPTGPLPSMMPTTDLARDQVLWGHYSLFRSLKTALFTKCSKSWLCIADRILKTSWAIQKHMKAIIIIVLL